MNRLTFLIQIRQKKLHERQYFFNCHWESIMRIILIPVVSDNLSDLLYLHRMVALHKISSSTEISALAWLLKVNLPDYI